MWHGREHITVSVDSIYRCMASAFACDDFTVKTDSKEITMTLLTQKFSKLVFADAIRVVTLVLMCEPRALSEVSSPNLPHAF
jgi:hypothetical protein